ncbi:MAG TPA: phosphatase PAP2 family protein [Candidatus Acidoferrum sp.]|nr:phosphatase PAP2 family protein [Candidatus Acidoferrum sp.]
MNRASGNRYRHRNYEIAAVETVLPRNDGAAEIDAQGSSYWEWTRREFAAAWAACGTFEHVALGYLGISSALIVWFAENLAHLARLLGAQALVAALILSLCRIEALIAGREEVCERAVEETDGYVWPTMPQKVWHFWRHWYPHLFFLFCFEEMGRLVHLVQPAWQDAKLIAFDHWLTGVNPSLWLEQFAHPALNELMQFAYFTYFFFLLILCGILYYRREWESYWAVMTYSAIGYALGYVIAIFFPVQSPWFTFAGMWHGELTGGPFTALINLIEKCGRVHGAAFPSQHVAGAMAALWGAWRHQRWLFWVFLPFVSCMCVSTVYVRNHYVADVFGGMITGTLGYVIGSWLMERRLPAVDSARRTAQTEVCVTKSSG